jgi:CheY-like chemotaxis protein
MASEEERANLNEPVLAPFVPGIAFAGERPAALLALGLQRAWCVVDRIVWRIAAEPERDDGGPFTSATRSVRLDDGERFWVLPPAWCLRDVTPLQAPPPAPRPRMSTAPALVETHEAFKAHEAHEAHEAREPYTPAPMFELLRSQEPEPIAEETLAQLRAQVDEALGRLEPVSPVSPVSPVPPVPPVPPAPAAQTSVISAWDALDQLTFESPAAPPEGALEPAAEAIPAPAPVAPAPAPAPVVDAPAPGSSRIFSARLEVLRPESVQRLDAPVAAPPAPITPIMPPTTVAPSAPIPPPTTIAPSALVPPPAPIAHAPGPRRALLVDDSLVARVFLTRLLERRGFIVEQAADAAECWTLLPEQEWAVLLIDVALPDARGGQHIADVVAFANQSGGVPVVALTRDSGEEREALMAGAVASLRKPFESTAVDDLLHLLPTKHPPTPESPR